VVKYLFDWICSQMHTLAGEEVGGQGTRAYNSYKQGVVATIAKRLRDAREKAKASARIEAMLDALDSPSGSALVLVEDAIGRLDLYREASVGLSKKKLTGSWQGGRRGISDISSFDAGVQAGGRIQLEGSKTAGRLE
jgi:hypothetical protein